MSIGLFSPIVAIGCEFWDFDFFFSEELIPDCHFEVVFKVLETALTSIFEFAAGLADFCHFCSLVLSWPPFEDGVGPGADAAFSSESVFEL